jgi:CcmD family protein
VALVVLIIWMGLAIHLWRLSRRIEKLEKLTEKP